MTNISPHIPLQQNNLPEIEALSVVNTNNLSSKSILDLTNDEAKKWFLKPENYCNFDLPEYFKFENILISLDNALDGKNLSDFRQSNPRDIDNINYKVLNNKDGKYAWRPLQLIHPAIYVSLVHKITSSDNWKIIQARFKGFSQNTKIECISIPRQSLTNNSDKAEQISNWWHQIEQRSIEMALDYPCLTHTDLADCYGAIYTHSIAWAIHGKTEAKASRRDKNLIGNIIDNHLQDMSQGQTNGIPQGSGLMDFIAESVLGYADLELGQRLENENIVEYKILRYRDDYRIFSHSMNDNEQIVKCLTEVMIDLGLKLSAEKTSVSDNVIRGSIKDDKLYWMKQKQTDRSLQKHLLIIHDLAIRFPNCGSLSTALKKFYDKLCKRKTLKESIIPLISISVDIAHKNPRTYQYISAIISLLLKFEDNSNQKNVLLEKIVNKFNNIPNTGHLDIWVQRVALGIRNNSMDLKEPLCKLVSQEEVVIWDLSWLKDSLKAKIAISSIVDQEAINNIPEFITQKEIELFNNDFNSDG